MTPADLNRDAHPAALELRLFGPFEARVAGAPLPRLRSRKGQWLLALLALRAGREVPREWLAETLWPDSDPEAALQSLRQSLTDLRRALGSAAARLQSPTPRALRLELEGCLPDVAEFDAAVQRKDPARLEAATRLHRGPLLDGWSEPWVLQERETRLAAYLHALETLASGALAEGRNPDALRFLRLACAADPLREESHRLLMVSLADAGEPQAAMEVYQQLRRRLRDEFNASPLAETTALFERLRRHTRAVVPHPVTAAHRLTVQPPPTVLSRLIGREGELLETRTRLLASRLLTLTGPGGMGKTRLAVTLARECAGEHADGAAWLALDALTDAAQLQPALAAALGLESSQDVTLTTALKERELLLVLDNCEHLLEPCAKLAIALLGACPSLRILATSRQRLGVAGETVRRLKSLSVPENDPNLEGASLLEYGAVQLFMERATAADPDFRLRPEDGTALQSVCRRLDGLPLALELAAGLLTVFTLPELAAELERRIELPAGPDPTQPARHRTLEAVVDWSYQLLDDAERTLFRRLAAFSGGGTRAAVEAVAGETSALITPLLARLVEKSLVVAEVQDGRSRYRMLEVVREFARARLAETAEELLVLGRHFRYFLRLAEQAAPALTGPEQGAWLRRLDQEYPNCRRALERALNRAEAGLDSFLPSPAPSILRLAAALGRYWQIRGYYSEGRLLLRRALAVGTVPNPDRAAAAGWAGFLAIFQGDYAEARRLLEETLAHSRAAGNHRGTAEVLGSLAIVAKDTGSPAEAVSLFEESLALWRQLGEPVGVAGTLGYLGILAKAAGEYPRARTLYQEALRIRQAAQDRWGVAASLNNLGLLALAEGELAEAEQYLQESLTIRRELGDRRCMAISLNNLGAIACRRGELGLARGYFAESLHLCRALGDRRSVAYSLEAFARLAAAETDWEGALTLAAAASTLRQNIGAPLGAAEASELEYLHSAARAVLGEPRYATLLGKGASLPLEEAIALALRS